MVGNSCADLKISGVLEVEEDTVIEAVKHILPLQEPLKELSCPKDLRLLMERAWKEEAKARGILPITCVPVKETAGSYPVTEAEKMAEELTAKLSEEQLTAMVIGEISKGQGQALGSAGIMVPGAAGETSSGLEEAYGVPGSAYGGRPGRAAADEIL